MTPDEAGKRKLIFELGQRQHNAYEGLVAPARAAVNVLKDHGQHSTARDLEAALFTLDATDAELYETFRKDPEAFYRALKRAID